MIDTLIRSKRKTIALQVAADGTLLVRAPRWVSRKDIDAFVVEKAHWIEKQKEEARKRRAECITRAYRDGEHFFLLGNAYPLEIIPKARRSLHFKNETFFLTEKGRSNAASHFEKWYRKEALHILNDRVRDYEHVVKNKPTHVRITSAKTLWGSCSPSGTLNFPWRLIMAPLPVIDCVVVHELIHLEDKTHSRSFWNRVYHIMPHYNKAKTWLRDNHHLMGL